MQFTSRATTLSPFLAMAYGEKATQLESQGKEVIRLNLGEPDFGAPDAVINAMKKALESPTFPYTSALGLPPLREAIATFYQSQHGINVEPARIVVTPGASGALLLCSAALVAPGDNIILGDPSYPCNRRFLESFGGDVTLVPTGAEQNFQLTAQDVETHWQPNTKGVLIASPANPTGTAIHRDELIAIGNICKRRNGFLIVDEIYLNLSLAASNDLNTILAVNDLQDTVIIINSFSKYFGMTGWRLGWCVLPLPMVPVVEKLAQNLFICPSHLSQQAALACFTPQALTQCEENRAVLKLRAQHVFSALRHMGLPLEVLPQGAFYAYINIRPTGMTAVEFCDALLSQYGVALTPGNDFGDYRASHYVRLSFATSDEKLKEGLTRLAQFVAPPLTNKQGE